CTCMRMCRRPISGFVPGSVTSSIGPATVVAKPVFFCSNAPLTSSFSALTRCPTSGFCSLATLPTSLIKLRITPLLPRYFLMDTSAPPPDPNRAPVVDYDAHDALRDVARTERGKLATHLAAVGGSGLDIWLSAIFGIIFLFMGINFGKFLVAELSRQPFYDY